jgi:hypothetical protein
MRYGIRSLFKMTVKLPNAPLRSHQVWSVERRGTSQDICITPVLTAPLFYPSTKHRQMSPLRLELPPCSFGGGVITSGPSLPD